MTPEEVLREAATLIREQGWWQLGKATGAHEGFCAMTAVMAVASGGDMIALRKVAYDIACERAGVESLTDWNDAPGRTVDEVLAVLER